MAIAHEKLKSLDGAGQYVRPGVTIGQLDALARSVSDLDAAPDEMFRAIAADVAA